MLDIVHARVRPVRRGDATRLQLHLGQVITTPVVAATRPLCVSLFLLDRNFTGAPCEFVCLYHDARLSGWFKRGFSEGDSVASVIVIFSVAIAFRYLLQRARSRVPRPWTLAPC